MKSKPRLLIIEDGSRAWRQDLLGLLHAGGYVTRLSGGNIVLTYPADDSVRPSAVATA